MTDLPSMKIKAMVSFPANALGGTGIEVDKANGNYVIGLDYSEFAFQGTLPPNTNTLVWDPVTNVYMLVPPSAVGGITDAPSDNQTYGRKNTGWVSIDGGGSFTQAGTGAVPRSAQDKMRDFVHVRDFGAVCDGVADDTAAIQAALNTGKNVMLPSAATCKISGTLNISAIGAGLVGAGWNSSVISSTSTTGVMIDVLADRNYVTLSGFKLTRSVTASADADGIYFAGSTEQTLISDIWIEKQFHGLTLGPTTYSVINNIISENNVSHGIYMIARPGYGALQWYINGALLQTNGDAGMVATAQAATVQNTLGTWTRIITFNNTRYGVVVSGTPTAPIHDINMFNCFIGSDHITGLYLDTYGRNHLIGNLFAELCGANGIEVTGNNLDVRFVNATSDDNGQSGFNLGAVSQRLTLSGCRGSNNASYGLDAADGGKLTISGCDFASGNVAGPTRFASNLTSLVASANSPQLNASIPAVLGSDVLLNNVANFFDGPSVTLGAGTWLITAKITLQNTAGPAGVFGKLWDGTNVIDSGHVTIAGSGYTAAMPLSGVITCNSGTIVKVSARDSSTTTSKILASVSGFAKDSSITATRIG